MRPKKIILVLCLLFTAGAASAGVSMSPYIYLNTGEAFVISQAETTPSLSFSTSIMGDFAALIKIGDRLSIIPFYELVYQGPGLNMGSKQGADFQQQTQEHSVFVKGSYRLNDALIIHSNADYALQLTRSGSNEAWADGIYNICSVGIDAYPEIIFGGNNLKPGYYYVNCVYPNYVSLLGMIDKSLAIPQQDHIRQKIYITGESALGANMFLEYSPAYTFKNYKWQKTIDQSGVENGPLQDDRIAEVGLKFSLPKVKYPAVPGIALVFDYLFTWYYSNQNSIQTTDTGSIVPNSWMQYYYDYRQHKFTPQVFVTFPNNIQVSLSYDYSLLDYPARQPRASDGTWVAGQTEYDIARTLTTGVSFPMGKFALGVTYMITSAVSNMKYERYYKYTYDAQTVLVSYTFEY